MDVSSSNGFHLKLKSLFLLYPFYLDASSGYFSGVDQSEFEDIRSSTSAAQSMQSGPHVPLVPGSCQGVSPMIKMNNIVLKQVSHSLWI